LISDGIYLGATNSSLTVRLLTTEMSGDKFRCVVTAPIGSTTSHSAVLIVESIITPPSITIESAEQTAVVGARVTFTAVATGTPPLQFQWRKNGSEIPGATGADLVFEAVSPNDAGVYVVAVSNASGFVALAHATLTITTSTVLPMINAQPNDRTVDEGADVEFLVVATGTLPLAHQWERQAAGAASWSNLSDGAVYSGTASSSLSIVHVVASMNGDQFRCVVTNMSGTVTSGVATLTVISPNQLPSI